MTHDPLQALLRLRRITADEARREIAECLRIESEAAAAVAAIKASIERETEVAIGLAAGDAEVEAFGAWLRRVRPKQRAALAAEDEAATATVRARTLLGAARAAVRAVEEMLEKHAATAHAAAERKAQGEIDETALQSSANNASSANRRISEGAKIVSPSPCGRGLGGGGHRATTVPTLHPPRNRNG